MKGILNEDSFIDNIISILDIDKTVGLLIYNDISSNGQVTAENFIEYVNKFRNIPISTQKDSEEIIIKQTEPIRTTEEIAFDPVKFIRKIEEESQYPFFDILDYIYFNDKGIICLYFNYF